MMRIERMVAYLVGIVFTMAVCGCRYDKQELADAVLICDTTAMTYTKSIQPIIQLHCYSCHAGAASGSFGINLDNYDNLKSEAHTGELLRRLVTSDESERMPKGEPRLNDCDINKISAWINAGTPQ